MLSWLQSFRLTFFFSPSCFVDWHLYMPCIMLLINNMSGILDSCGVLIFKYVTFCCLIALISDDELLCNSVKFSTRTGGPICLICKVRHPWFFPYFPYPYVIPSFGLFVSPPEWNCQLSYDSMPEFQLFCQLPHILSRSSIAGCYKNLWMLFMQNESFLGQRNRRDFGEKDTKIRWSQNAAYSGIRFPISDPCEMALPFSSSWLLGMFYPFSMQMW